MRPTDPSLEEADPFMGAMASEEVTDAQGGDILPVYLSVARMWEATS
ncbi:hypothetical protein [Luteibacter sp. CQ10]